MTTIRKLADYKDVAKEMIEEDVDLRAVQREYLRLSHLDYTPPAPLQRMEWFRIYRSTAPADALDAGAKSLGSLERTLRINPMTVLKAVGAKNPNGEEARRTANMWETILNFHVEQAELRTPGLRYESIYNGLLYDEQIEQILHIPTQIKAIKSRGGDTRRLELARQYGDWAFLVRSPLNVHVQYSEFMPERVLTCSIKTPKQLEWFWGEQGKMKDDCDQYTEFYYQDPDVVCAWAIEGDVEDANAAGFMLLRPQENPFKCLTFAVARKGIQSDDDPGERIRPLLYKVLKSELWLSANIAGSLMSSESIAEFGSPKLSEEGSNPQQAEVDMGEPGRIAKSAPGNTLRPLPQQGVNPALREMLDRFIGDMDRATVAKVLQTAEAIPNEPFAGFNMRVQAAVNSLIPFKQLDEEEERRRNRTMLLMAHNTGTNIEMVSSAKDDYGKKLVIDSEDIDPSAIVMSVSLAPDINLMRPQKVQAANLLFQMGMPDAMIFEELGETDPEKRIMERDRDMFRKAIVASRIQAMQFEMSGQMQQAVQQAAQQMLEQAQQQGQQQGPGGPQPGTPGNEFPQGPQGMPGAEGMNPAAGSPPPATMSPEQNTFENQTGQTRGGEEMAL